MQRIAIIVVSEVKMARKQKTTEKKELTPSTEA
jgi:hypothetical protein